MKTNRYIWLFAALLTVSFFSCVSYKTLYDKYGNAYKLRHDKYGAPCDLSAANRYEVLEPRWADTLNINMQDTFRIDAGDIGIRYILFNDISGVDFQIRSKRRYVTVFYGNFHYWRTIRKSYVDLRSMQPLHGIYQIAYAENKKGKKSESRQIKVYADGLCFVDKTRPYTGYKDPNRNWKFLEEYESRLDGEYFDQLDLDSVLSEPDRDLPLPLVCNEGEMVNRL